MKGLSTSLNCGIATPAVGASCRETAFTLRAATSSSKSMEVRHHREIRWLASQVRPFLRLHLGSYFCIVIASILVLLDPLIVRRLIDDVIPHRRVSWLPFVAAAFFLTYMGRLGFDSLAAMLNF